MIIFEYAIIPIENKRIFVEKEPSKQQISSIFQHLLSFISINIYKYSMKCFKEQYTLAKRQEMYNKAVQQHPKKIAVVVQAHPRSKLAINKYFKFMANQAYTASSIQENIRKQLLRTNQIPKNDTTAIYLFCKNKLLKASDFLKDLQKDRDPEDNFLYLMVAETQAF